MPKKKNNKWPWPWKQEEEATWGELIMAAYGEITDLDRKLHMTLLSNYQMRLLDNKEFPLAMRRRLIVEPPTVSEEGVAKLASLIKDTTGHEYERPVAPTESNQAKESVEGKLTPFPPEGKGNSMQLNGNMYKTNALKIDKSDSKKRQKLAALRASRFKKPELTHKQRWQELKSSDPMLWGNMNLKTYKQLAQLEKKTPPKDVGVYQVPVTPQDADCQYPCQLCGKALQAGTYEITNIQFGRPDGDYEGKSLQWAIDNDLYERPYAKDNLKKVIIACTSCTLPAPWGDGLPITEGSVSTDYKNENLGSSVGSLSRHMENMARLDDYSDEDDYGYSDDDMDDLLCQGVKPWDDDAGDILAAIHGAYDYY